MRQPTLKQQHRKTYQTWINMRDRCSNPDNASYRYWGARGVRVCDRWQNSFEAFLEDMGDRQTGRSIDRINNTGNYPPDNCRWATPRQQARNKRPRTPRLYVEYNDVVLPVILWTKRQHIKYDKLRSRLRQGWPVERALFYNTRTPEVVTDKKTSGKKPRKMSPRAKELQKRARRMAKHREKCLLDNFAPAS